jgi:hypothetical protein
VHYIGNTQVAVDYLAASYVPSRKTRWTKLPVRRGTLRLRLDYQPDEHAHTIHVRHDPRDLSVSSLQRGTYYGHVNVDISHYYPFKHCDNESEVLALLESFVRCPRRILTKPRKS